MIKKNIAKRQRTTPTVTDLGKETFTSPDWIHILCSPTYQLRIFRTLPRKTFLNLRRCHRTWHDLPWRLIFERDVNPPMSTTSPDITQLKDEFWLLQLLNKQYCHNQPPLKDNKDYTACAQAYTILQQDPDSISPEQEEKLATLYSSLTTPTQPGLRMKAINSIQDDPIESAPLNTHIQHYINTNLHKEKETLFDKLEEKPGSNEEAKAKHTADVTDMITNHPLLVFATDEDGDTTLHLAAWKGHTEVAKYLLANWAEVNAKNNEDETPLHWAAQEGHTDIVRILLNAGAEVKARDGGGWTPLHLAAQEGKLEDVEALLQAEADVEAKDKDGYTPLHWAAESGKLETVKALLKAGADPTAKNKSVKTPLQLAAYWVNTDIAELLRKAGATV